MPALPWSSFAAPESGSEYVALLSYLPLNKFRALPKFVTYTLQIRRQLADPEGAIGYSLDANVPGRKFWTLSVWEDEESLSRFVQRTPHNKAMPDLLRDMGQTEFVRFGVDAASVPPDWEEARRRMESGRVASDPRGRQENAITKGSGGEGKSYHSWKGNPPPNRPAPAACDHILPRHSDECVKNLRPYMEIRCDGEWSMRTLAEQRRVMNGKGWERCSFG